MQTTNKSINDLEYIPSVLRVAGSNPPLWIAFVTVYDGHNIIDRAQSDIFTMRKDADAWNKEMTNV